ncbi:uncharacterized protein LOC133186962 [Saccostrea echinata]|uniref:uncharacterized protein LOC133186962 n=1 Tax=Saccostrea echinata TaxID=191078 RepID=UPI002A839CD9|nr:uncharacterized protein LOC133186962 [Saccostrea echinata]
MDIAENYLGQVTHVIDPDNFSMQVGTDECLAEFIQFEMRLEDFGQTCDRVSDLSALEIGQIILVECMETKEGWRRGQVANVNSEESGVDVVYIDYGHSEHVGKSRLCTDFPEEFGQYPSMAIKCQLAGIKPIARTWTTKAVKMFTEITQGHVFFTFFLPTTHMFKSMVALYFQQGGDNPDWAGRSLSHVLMDQELGIVSENEVTEYLENAAEFCKEKFQLAAYSESIEANEDVEVPDSDFISGMSNEEENEDGEDFLPVSGESPDNAPSDDVTEESPQETNEPSTDEGTSEYTSSPEGPLDHSSHIGSTNGENKIVISDFDFDRIHHTKDICTNRLEERKAKQTRQELEQENEKILEDVKECKSLAVEAGYGIADHFEDTLPPRFSQAGGNALPLIPLGTVTPGLERPSSQNVIDDRMPSKRYSRTRREARPGVEERMELGPMRGRGRARPAIPQPSGSSPVIGLSGIHPSRDSPVIGLQSCSSPVIGSSGLHPSRGSPVIGSSSSQVIGSRSSPVIDFSGYNPETPPSNNRLDSLYKASPEKREELVQTLKKIFAEADRDTEEETRARLQSLFFTDLFMYLDKEQLKEVIYVLLNRAVRYYGDIHDVLLDIIQILNVTEDFPDCLYLSCKKIEENYIKIQMMGSPFHVQASKVLAHIFIMSLHWSCSNQIQEMILSALEKWIIFNKTAQQLGQDRLQELYIECFNIVWCIVGSHICRLYPEHKARLQKECRNKILNDNVSRLVRSKLLDLYIEKFVISPTAKKEEVHTCTQTKTLTLVDKEVQTDMIKITERRSQAESPSPVATAPEPWKKSKTKTLNSNKKATTAESKKDIEWPKLSGPKVPDWTNRLLDSPRLPDWSSPEGSNSSVRKTPESLSSSLYFSAEDKSFQSSPDIRQSSFLNSPDNLRKRNLNQLRNPIDPPVVTEPIQTFTNWSDNMVFGSKSNFLSSDLAPKKSEDERKSQLLKNKLCALAEPKSDSTGLKAQSSTFQQNNSKKEKHQTRQSGGKEVSNSSSRNTKDLKEEQKSRDKEPVSWWDSTGSLTRSNLKSPSFGSEDDSSGSEKRPMGRGRGRRVKKEFPPPPSSTSLVQKSDISDEISENHVSSQKRVNPLRAQRNENPLRFQNQNANCNKVSGATGGKSPQKVMDWFSMEEVETGDQPPETGSRNEDNVPDHWFLVSDDEKSAKYSQNSDMQALPSQASDISTNQKNAIKGQVSQNGDSPSQTEADTEMDSKFDEEDGSGDCPTRPTHFSDEEGEDDGLWETESSDDEVYMRPANTASSDQAFSGSTGVSKWVPGERKCTLCGATDHVIYKCHRKKDNSFFL